MADSASFDHLSPFLSPSLRNLSLSSTGGDDEDEALARTLCRLAEDTAASGIRLTHLSLVWSGFHTATLEPAVVSYLQAQPGLVSLSLSDIPAAGPIGRELAKPELRELTLLVTLRSGDELHSLLSLLPEHSPHLASIHLSLLNSGSDNISLPDIKPILRLTQLKKVLIDGDRPLELHEADMAKMGAAWPFLEHLRLSPTSTTLPISIIPKLAKECSPTLTLLDFDASFHDISSVDIAEIRPFPSLRRLLLGHAEAPGGDGAAQAAELLSKLCPHAQLSIIVRPNGGWSDILDRVKTLRSLQEHA